MCKWSSPWIWALSGTIVSVLWLAGPVRSAAVGNITTAKISLSNLELNASASRNVYKTASPQRQADSAGSAAQVGFYKVDTEAAGVPSGLRAQAKGRGRGQEDPRSARLRQGRRPSQVPSPAPSADLFEEDAEEIDEEDLKGKGRGRAGSRRPPSSDEDHDLGRQRVAPRLPPQPGYKPFGAGEVVAPPLKKIKQDDFKQGDDEESADFGDHSSSGDSGGSHASYSSGSSSGSDDHDDYKGGDSSGEEDDSDHHAEDGGEGAAYKAHDEESEDDGHHHDESAPSSESLKEDLHEKLGAKKLDDIKPASEEGDHESHASLSDNTHTSASTDAKSEDYVSAPHHHPKSHSYSKGGEKKHKAEHHAEGGEKGSKGYKKKQAKDVAEAGKHGKEAHKVHSKAKKGHKKAHLDQAGKYAEKYEGEKGKKGAEFADKGKHKKGHSTKGFRTVHRKDEFKKDETFYDEADNQGHHAKKGAVHKHHGGKKGEKHEKKHLDAKQDVGKASKEAEKGHGKHSQAKKGHKGEEHEEAKKQSLSKNAKEGGSKVAHKSAHAQKGHDDHY